MRPNSQARTGTGKYFFPCSADDEQGWQPYPVGLTLAICVTIHTYIHILYCARGESLFTILHGS